MNRVPMKRRGKILFIFFLFLIVGFGFLIKYRVAIVSQIVPIIESDTINIIVKNDTAYASTKLIATNKSFLPLKIDSIKYKIGIYGEIYLHEEKFLGIYMPPFSKDTFAFDLKIPVTRILTDLREIRKKSQKANYSISVALQYSTIFGRIELPINRSAKFKLPPPPEIKILEVDYTKVRIRYMLADVKIRVTNFNPISLTFKSIKFHLEIPGQGSADGDRLEPLTILPRAEIFITLPIIIDFEHLGKTIMDVAQDDDSYNYILTCNAEILTPNPNQKPIFIELTKHGRMELKKENKKNKSDKKKTTLKTKFSNWKDKKDRKLFKN